MVTSESVLLVVEKLLESCGIPLVPKCGYAFIFCTQFIRRCSDC